MKNISKIILFPLLLGACETSQSPAKVEYHLENYYGYGDVQGPPTENSPEATAMRDKGVPVVIEDISKDNNISSGIQEENLAPQNQRHKSIPASDSIGPENQGKIIPNPVTSDTQQVNISSKSHIVKKGETLFSLSRQYDIPILPIIVANGLESPYSLTEGQQVKIPEGRFHVVKEGETLYSISRQYGVDMSGIVKLNDLKQPYNVVLGQKLQLPFPSDLPDEDKTEALAETQSEIQQDKPQEETIMPEKISSASDDINKPASLRKPTGGILGEMVTDKDGNIISTRTSQAAPQPVDTEMENEALAKNTSEKIAATEPTDQTKANVKDDGKLLWPVKGKVLKKFGQQGGEYNDGINIAASAGTEVKAANAGRVVYTGNSLKSYGNMVIIKHDNGILSAYAHMNNVNVKKDQQVSKGQSIGTVGSTGKVTSPQLYFAIRKGKDAKDPLNYLSK